MKTGLIITKQADGYAARPHGVSPEANPAVVGQTPGHAVVLALQLYGKTFAWVYGDGVTKKTAKTFGLGLRQRLPGAGRKPNGYEPLRQFTVWADPATIVLFRQVAEWNKRSQVEQFRAMVHEAATKTDL